MTKTEKTAPPKTIDEYLIDFPEDIQEALEDLRKFFHAQAPGLQETISYGIPTFNWKGKHCIGFAAFKNHCSLFVMSGSLLSRFQEETKGYKQSKSGIHFTVEKPLPEDLVQKLLSARVHEIEALVKK